MTYVIALCGICRARFLSLVAVLFAAHWILELFAIGALARVVCN